MCFFINFYYIIHMYYYFFVVLLLFWGLSAIKITSNYPVFPIQSSYFPIRFSIQCLRVFFYNIFPFQSRSSQRSFNSWVLVHGHPFYVILAFLACLAYWILRYLIVITMFSFLNELSSSLFFLFLQSPVSLSFTGLKFFLRIFFSKTSIFISSFFFNGQVYAP